MMRVLRWNLQRPSYALVASTIGVMLAVSGTAVAAATITGGHIKNNTLTGKDVRNSALDTAAVPTETRRLLALRGGEGPAGPKGPIGPSGDAGATGDQGTPAKNAFAWAYQEQNSLLRDRSSSNGGPTTQPEDWWDQAGTGEWTNPDSGFGSVLLELADGKNDGLLKLEARSDVVATAHLTAWHEDASVHSRLECRLRIVNIATNSQATMGQPVIIAAKEFRQVVDFGLVGGIRRDAGTYAVKVECRDLDLNATGYQKWFVAKGNLSVLSARDWR